MSSDQIMDQLPETPKHVDIISSEESLTQEKEKSFQNLQAESTENLANRTKLPSTNADVKKDLRSVSSKNVTFKTEFKLEENSEEEVKEAAVAFYGGSEDDDKKQTEAIVEAINHEGSVVEDYKQAESNVEAPNYEGSALDDEKQTEATIHEGSAVKDEKQAETIVETTNLEESTMEHEKGEETIVDNYEGSAVEDKKQTETSVKTTNYEESAVEDEKQVEAIVKENIGKNVVDDILSSMSAESISKELINNVLSKVDFKGSVHEIAKGVVKDIIKSFESSTSIAIEIVNDIVNDFDSAHNVVEGVLHDIVQKFDSANSIAKDIVEEIVNQVDSSYLSKSDGKSIIKTVPSSRILYVKYSELLKAVDTKLNEICYKYLPADIIAEEMITDIIKESLDILAIKIYKRASNISLIRISTDIFDKQGVFWPPIGDFSIEKAMTYIDDFLNNWNFQEEWLFFIEYIMAQSTECSDFYLFEAKCSIPTKEYPVAQATASVFFTVEVSRIKPKVCPIKVTYVFEGSRLVHDCHVHIFREEWLFNIIDAKLALFKCVNF